ncbi:hypothetical protein AVEN_34734-1 [Araneus ventricosus]|uniref:Uncharacterized protein n=1 Tax=Araneus ventricosus TaxID=182803 RepID=A0A4Y2RV52_ARAVE|nr:hypothetical protein AVEN_34734-1 [Araneus ventricosus]
MIIFFPSSPFEPRQGPPCCGWPQRSSRDGLEHGQVLRGVEGTSTFFAYTHLMVDIGSTTGGKPQRTEAHHQLLITYFIFLLHFLNKALQKAPLSPLSLVFSSSLHR